MSTNVVQWSNFDDQVRYQPISGILPGALWTPADITTRLWFDGNNTGQAEGALSQWDDLSGNADHLLQATSADQPNLAGTTVVCAADFMAVNLGVNITSDKVAYFGVLKRISAVADTSTATLFNSSAADFNIISSGILAYEPDATTQQGYRIAAKSSQSHAGNNIEYMIGSIFDGTNHTIYKNGNGASAVSSSGSFNADRFALNSRWISDYTLPGNNNFREVILVVGDLDTTTRQKIEGYFAWKWDTINGNTDLVTALPAGHPYKSAAPTV